ncbi:MAG: hypothetical protein ING73_08905 [Rhodocyclaceae bacterium]|nr:hypothetical protein [Rhodocyclaceae bacterium]MCA3045312.1 hypothetical protein [Rhodocyclaceae bacterium]MCA3048492.1 hypothetical protein [Rhodocyclaceae bacterium]MCA3052609.1 hypothetical protein [Rhodocyclaceae bacterium]MCA3059608.1 hypothetical protein [Rhodocyclaceae bacterium]
MSMLKPAIISLSPPLAATLRLLHVGVSIAALTLFANGCTFWQPSQTPLPSTASPSNTVETAKQSTVVLSETAAAALEQARLQVADAKRSRALWKSAAEKLNAAELAASRHDSANTLRLSNEIISLCEQSRAQLLFPPVAW